MNVQILTTQNVEIEYELAGIGNRIVARMIDMIITFAYFMLGVIVVIAVDAAALVDRDGEAFFLLLSIPALLYAPLLESLLEGQTVGKRLMKIRVVRLDGTPATVWHYFLRWLVGLVEMTPGVIAFIAVVASRNEQRLGDMAAGTTVVKVRDRVELSATMLRPLPEDYVPRFPTVDRLSDRDVALIVDILRSPEARQNPVAIGALERRVKGVLAVESDLPPIQFLRTVVKDYNAVTSRSASAPIR